MRKMRLKIRPSEYAGKGPQTQLSQFSRQIVLSHCLPWASTTMPVHVMSKNTKIHIPALFQDGFIVREICHLLGVKKMLIYKTLNYYKNFGGVYNPWTYSNNIEHCCILSTADTLSIWNTTQHCNTIYLNKLAVFFLRSEWIVIEILNV